MENKSILIQSDEVTKNMMNELQDDMIDSLSRVANNMTEEVMEILKPIEKKLNEFKREFQDFQEDNEDFGEQIDELNNNLSKVSQSIKNTLEDSIKKIIIEQTIVINNSLNKLVENTEKIKVDIENNENELLKAVQNSTHVISEQIKTIEIEKIDERIDSLEENIEHKTKSVNNNIRQLDETLEQRAELLNKNVEDKIALLGKYIVREENISKEDILNKIDGININEIEKRIELVGKGIENNLSNSEDNILERVNAINEKIDAKNILIEIISKMENEFTQKINKIQEEVEWGNRSFFSRLFGKKR